MIGLYVFSFVLGGGFLLLSLLGDAFGDATDVELDGLELDVGGDMADALDVDIDSGVEVDGASASKILSLRTAVYGLFGFGAVGTLLTLTGAGGALSVGLLAVAGGLAAATLIHLVFHYLRATDTGALPGDASLVGLPGSVTLPLSETVPGTVVVQRGHRRLALRALPHPTATEDAPDAGRWSSVVIVEMTDGIARVAPTGDNLT